jgi:polysaccharide transporter, PST family
MNIAVATFANLLSNMVKLFCGLAVTKIVASQTGPAGLALIGQMGNFVTILLQYSNVGIGNGVVKHIAEYTSRNQPAEAIRLIDTALSVTVLLSVGIALVLYGFKDVFAVWILGDPKFSWIVMCLAVLLPVMSAGYLLLFVINGYKRIRDYAIIVSLQALIGVIFAWVLTVSLGVEGALLMSLASQTILFFIVVTFLIKEKKICLPCFKLERKLLRNLIRFAVMGLISGSLAPLTQMLLRSYIASHSSIEVAGLWQALCRLSETYLSVVITPLSMYYLPRLSEIDNYEDMKFELMASLRFSVPLTAALALALYALRNTIIPQLFSSDFSQIIPLLSFQLAGDVVKVTSWIFGMIMWAKSMTGLLVFTEIIFSTTFTVLSIFLFEQFGLVGTTYAYLLNYLIYFIFLIIYFSRNLRLLF